MRNGQRQVRLIEVILPVAAEEVPVLGIAGLEMRRPRETFRSLPNGVVIGKSDPPSGKCQRAGNGEDPGEEHPSHTRPGKTRLHRALLCQDTAPRATEKKFVVSKCKMSSHRVFESRASRPSEGLARFAIPDYSRAASKTQFASSEVYKPLAWARSSR